MFKYLIQHIILDTLYFPIWWYTRGLYKVLHWAKESIKDAERTVGLKIWLKSLFKPMYQDYTRSGRIVSFFMRITLLIFKLLMLIVWTGFCSAMIVMWMLLPITATWLTVISFK